MDTQGPQEQTVMMLTEAFRLLCEIHVDPLYRDALAQTITALLFDQWQQADAESSRSWALMEKAEEAKGRAKRRREGSRDPGVNPLGL